MGDTLRLKWRGDEKHQCCSYASIRHGDYELLSLRVCTSDDIGAYYEVRDSAGNGAKHEASGSENTLRLFAEREAFRILTEAARAP